MKRLEGKVAVVTGGNKGIGFAIVKGLCQRYDGDVYLTARDVTRGEEAVQKLKDSGLNPLFHQLDITDTASVLRFRDHIKEKNGGIDILVNNAAIAFKRSSTENFGVQAEKTIFVNYTSLVSTCKILFPILKTNARVVNLSSSAGHLSFIPDENLRNSFASNTLTEPQLSDLVKQFVEAAKDGSNVAKGWGSNSYAISKVAVSALTFIQNREYGPKGISLNCVHPGYVDTDMTSHMGPLTIEQGAAAPLYLALDAPQSVKGVYMYHDKTIVNWFGPRPEYY